MRKAPMLPRNFINPSARNAPTTPLHDEESCSERNTRGKIPNSEESSELKISA